MPRSLYGLHGSDGRPTVRQAPSSIHPVDRPDVATHSACPQLAVVPFHVERAAHRPARRGQSARRGGSSPRGHPSLTVREVRRHTCPDSACAALTLHGLGEQGIPGCFAVERPRRHATPRPPRDSGTRGASMSSASRGSNPTCSLRGASASSAPHPAPRASRSAPAPDLTFHVKRTAATQRSRWWASLTHRRPHVRVEAIGGDQDVLAVPAGSSGTPNALPRSGLTPERRFRASRASTGVVVHRGTTDPPRWLPRPGVAPAPPACTVLTPIHSTSPPDRATTP
jgi:hypothetical protein